MGRKDGAKAVELGESYSFNQLKQKVKLPFQKSNEKSNWKSLSNRFQL